MRRKTKFAVVPVLLLVVVAVLGYAVMVLWNLVIPTLFAGGRMIDFPHAIGLLALCRILFGGFRGRGHWRRSRHWEKWASLTPQERERLFNHGSRP